MHTEWESALLLGCMQVQGNVQAPEARSSNNTAVNAYIIYYALVGVPKKLHAHMQARATIVV